VAVIVGEQQLAYTDGCIESLPGNRLQREGPIPPSSEGGIAPKNRAQNTTVNKLMGTFKSVNALLFHLSLFKFKITLLSISLSYLLGSTKMVIVVSSLHMGKYC